METPPGEWLCYRVTLLTPSGERTLTVGGDKHIWDAALAAGIKLPALCHQGRCLTCAGQVEGTGDFDQNDSDAYYAADREAGFILLCTAKARSDLRVRTHCQHAMRTHRRCLGLPAPYA